MQKLPLIRGAGRRYSRRVTLPASAAPGDPDYAPHEGSDDAWRNVHNHRHGDTAPDDDADFSQPSLLDLP